MGLEFGTGSDGRPMYPSAKGVELTLPASGTALEAPADGWFYLSLKPQEAGSRVCLMNKGTYKHMKFSQFSSAAKQLISIYVPCKKGDEVAPLYTSSTNSDFVEWFCFIYAD